ncbi:MAG: HAD-IA family hydrolase [Acidobacteria bacterium]|nr:HAD-IA family hydrolase [Acidobacteriota bacterium]
MAPEITHIIYDNDGLLLDTEPFYTKAHQIMAARFGKVFDWAVKSKMIGLRAEDSANVIINALQLPFSVAEYLEERKHLLKEMFPQAEPMPGAVHLTMHLHGLGIPQAVATSSDRYYFDLKITHHKEWYKIFQCVVFGDDPEIRQGKPAPDIFLLAAERLRADPSHCLVVEDSPAGIEAARAAGMFAVAVPDPNMDDRVYSGAHQIIRSLNELDLSSWGFPAYA